MGTLKDRNSSELVHTEEIKKRWKEYMEELYKKYLNELNYYAVVSHPEPDILECEVKWALGSPVANRASGCNGIPVELFKTLKYDAIKVLHSICQQIWETQQWPQDWKRSILIPIPKKGSIKNVLTIRQLHSSPKLKILHPNFSIMWTKNFQVSKLCVENEEEPEIKLTTLAG